MRARKILITKTAGEGTELADAVRGAGFEPVHEPLLSIEYVETGWPEIEPDAPLVFTSTHGVQAFSNIRSTRGHIVYTVGRNTAEAARAAGFNAIETVAGTVEELAQWMVQAPKTGLISPFYLRAEDVSQDLKGILTENGVNIRQFIAYRANGAENLSLNLLKSFDNREIYAVMLFSNRGGRVFAELVEQYDRAVRMKTIKALCISDSVLKSVSVLPFQQALVADTPDRYGMMKLLEDVSIS